MKRVSLLLVVVVIVISGGLPEAAAKLNLPVIGLKAVQPCSEGGIAILGDSITNGAPWGEDVVNLGVPGHAVRDGGYMFELVVSKKPERLYIWLGTNNVHNPAERSRFYADYLALLDLAAERLPETEIRVIGILPNRLGSIGVVRAFNDWLRNLCRERGMRFLDVYRMFSTKYLRDSLHPNTVGYQILVPIILSEDYWE